MLKQLITFSTVILLLANRNSTAEPLTTGTASEGKSAAKPAAAAIKFNGERAMADIVAQVNGGPRLPSSPGIAVTRRLITDTLTSYGWTVHEQEFEAYSPMLGQTAKGINLFAVHSRQTTVTTVLSAHYDTRPYADMDPDPARRQDPVPGANDGGSGVAVLLELGRNLPLAASPPPVALVFFDLEDHGTAGSNDGFCLGSRYFASHIPTQLQGFQQGINIDMVGKQGLELPMEGYSMAKAPKLTFDLWAVGSSFYPAVWKKERGPSIYDDHMPFLGRGIPYIDVIDIKYPMWHTTQDLPEHCSAQSLESVGDTLLKFILH